MRSVVAMLHVSVLCLVFSAHAVAQDDKPLKEGTSPTKPQHKNAMKQHKTYEGASGAGDTLESTKMGGAIHQRGAPKCCKEDHDPNSEKEETK